MTSQITLGLGKFQNFSCFDFWRVDSSLRIWVFPRKGKNNYLPTASQIISSCAGKLPVEYFVRSAPIKYIFWLHSGPQLGTVWTQVGSVCPSPSLPQNNLYPFLRTSHILHFDGDSWPWNLIFRDLSQKNPGNNFGWKVQFGAYVFMSDAGKVLS